MGKATSRTRDHLQVVDVQAVNNVPAANSATVKPANVDDWEVVESNAEYLTDNMLNQVPVCADASDNAVAAVLAQPKRPPLVVTIASRWSRCFHVICRLAWWLWGSRFPSGCATRRC